MATSGFQVFSRPELDQYVDGTERRLHALDDMIGSILQRLQSDLDETI